MPPWEKYQQAAPAAEPWTRYSAPQPAQELPAPTAQQEFENPTGLAGVLRSISEPLGRFNRAFTNGYTLGLADEIEGVADAAMIDQTYGQAVDAARQRADAGAAQYPVISGIGNLLGGVSQGVSLARGMGMAPAQTVGGQAIQGAKLGAIEGGLFGFNDGEDGLTNRAMGAAQGAGMGAAVGAAAPYAVEGVRRGVNAAISGPVASMRSTASPVRASRAVETAIKRSGRSVDEIEAAIRQAHLEGQPLYTIADATGNSGQRMLAGASRTPGDVRQEIIEFLAGRQSDQGRRLGGALDDALNAPRNTGNLPVPYGTTGPDAQDFRGMTAKQVEEFLKEQRSKAANAAYKAARENAAPVDVRGALAVIDDRIGPMQGSGIAGDGIDGKLASYRSRLATGKPGARFEGADSVELSDFSRVLGVKQEIQDDIGAAIRAGRNNEARELSQVVSRLDEALEAASGPYRQANDGFREASRVIDQIEAGKAATSPRARIADTRNAYGALNDPQRAAFRAGYADPLLSRIENSATGVNNARPLMSQGSQQELGMMARDPDRLQRFIRREDEMFRTSNAAMGGSMTADNLADVADVSAFDASPIINLLMGRWGTAATQLGETAMNAMTGRNTATREQIAKLLLSGDVRGALAPAAQRQIGNMQRSALIEALIRSAERPTNPLR